MAEAIAATVLQALNLTGLYAGSTAAVVVNAAVQVAVNAALFTGFNAIASQNSEQKQTGALIDLQLNSAAPRQLVIGKRMTGGVLVDWYLAGSNNTKLYLPVYLSEGPCGQIKRVFADGREVWSTPLSHGVRTTIPDFRSGGDRLWLTYYDGREGQTADATLVGLSQGWTSANKMTGCAWVLIECQWDSDNMRSPPSLSFEMEGAKLYDRRKDTTAGGSGSHRIDDPSTWEFSDNPAVALDHFLLGRYWDGTRTFGIGLSADEVPYSYFAAQANVCDEDVDLKAGGTQKRYRANGFIFANEDYATTITRLCTAMAARPADFGGRFGVIGVESKTPVLTIDDGDLIAGVQEVYTPKRSWSELVGEVEGRFQDPAQLYQPTPYPNVTDAAWAAEDGGEPKLMTLDLEMETDVERAQRLATLKARAERRQATLRGSYPLWTVELERGDWFVRTGAKWGVDGKTFEVIERVLDPATWTVTIVSQEVDATDSAWDETTASDGPPAPLDPTDTLSAVEVPAITVTAVTLAGTASTIPALKVAWTAPTDPRVRHFYVEVENVDGVTPKTVRSVLLPVDTSEIIVQDGIVDGDSYAVSAKFLTDTIPSDWCVAEIEAASGTYAVGTAASVPWSGVTGAGRPADNATVGARAGTNLYRTDGITVLTQAEVRTAEGVATAITGQGALATANSAAWGSQVSDRPSNLSALSGSEGINNALVPVGSNGLVDTEYRFQSTYWSKDSPSGSTTFGTSTSTAGLRKAVLTGSGLTVNGSDYIRHHSNAQRGYFPCKPGDVIGARVLAGGDNLSQIQLIIAFRNAAGSAVSFSTATVVSSGILTGTGEETDFNELTNYATAPAGTVTANIDVRGIASTSAPVLRIAKQMLAVLAAGQTVVPRYAPGREHEVGANVTETRTAAAITGQGSLATASSAAWASQVSGRPSNLSALGGSEPIQNALVAQGANALVDTGFRLTSIYWTTAGFLVSPSASYAADDGLRKATLTTTGSVPNNSSAQLQGSSSNAFPCDAGERIEASVYLGATAWPAAQLYVYWYDTSGTLLSQGYIGQATLSGYDGTGGLSTFTRLGGFATAPANTKSCRFHIRFVNLSGSSVSDAVGIVTLPFLRKADATQTALSPWSPGFEAQIAADVTSSNTAAAITSQGVLATANQVNLGASGRVYRDDGTTRLTDALAVTSLGTAAAIASQGALATANNVNTSTIAANAVTAADDDETDAGASISSSWVAVASSDLTTADADSRALIMFSTYISGTADGSIMDAQIKRGSTVIWGPKLIAGRPSELDFETTETGAISYTPEFNGMVSFFDTDVPGAAGTYTYSIELRVSDCAGSNPWEASYRRMFAMVFKR